MAAEDHLNPQQFYHGTNVPLQPGAMVGSLGPETSRNTPVYATTLADDARRYAHSAAIEERGVGGTEEHTYQVEPTGRMQRDPNDTEDTGGSGLQWMSTKPMRVVKEI
jgi:hypothetical protein